MTQSNIERLFEEVNIALEQLEISLKAIERVSNNSLGNVNFYEVEGALQEIRSWIYQRQATISSDREEFLAIAINEEIQEFYNETHTEDRQTLAVRVIDRLKSLFEWI
jgi:hypothetical protein